MHRSVNVLTRGVASIRRTLVAWSAPTVKPFFQELADQRWDDHRYYHHSRINQSLHLLSAISFLVAYSLLLVNPAWAALLAWTVSMVSRQAGHFFFEPRGFDEINQVTHEYKEAVKVGYNLRRKVVLMLAWAGTPLLLWIQPGLWGVFEPHADMAGFLHQLGWLWLWLGVGGLVLRVLQLWATQNLHTGLVWACKIVTDPFHDIRLYWRAPLHLLRGEWLEPGARRA